MCVVHISTHAPQTNKANIIYMRELPHWLTGLPTVSAVRGKDECPMVNTHTPDEPHLLEGTVHRVRKGSSHGREQTLAYPPSFNHSVDREKP